MLVANFFFALSAPSLRLPSSTSPLTISQISLRAPVRTQTTFVDLAFSLKSFEVEGAGNFFFLAGENWADSERSVGSHRPPSCSPKTAPAEREGSGAKTTFCF